MELLSKHVSKQRRKKPNMVILESIRESLDPSESLLIPSIPAIGESSDDQIANREFIVMM